MSAAALLTDLLRRGVRLEAAPDGLHYRAPRGTLTDADRASLRAHRNELLALLRAGDQPTDACLGCGTAAWFWCAAWPVPGGGRWLCRTCSTRPSPALHDVAAGLTADERRELESEEAAGDVLARLVLDTLAETAPPAAVEAVEDIAATLTRALSPDGPGWVVVWSGVLGEEVVFTRDGKVQVPAEYATLPRFTPRGARRARRAAT